MKKLIAIAVVFALIAGTAFAETTVGGSIFVGGTFLNGNNQERNSQDRQVHPQSTALGLDDGNSTIKIGFGEAEGGGNFRIKADNSWDMWYAWWVVSPMLRIQIGANPDGDFGTAQITGWGFTGEQKNNSGNQGALSDYGNAGSSFSSSRIGFYDGTSSTPNLQFSIFPAEGLRVNIWFPWGSNTSAADRFIKFHAQVSYKIPDIGTAFLSYKSDTGYLEADANSPWGISQANSQAIHASFYLTAIDNLGVDLGLKYEFPITVETAGIKNVSNKPFQIGLGARYVSGDFTIKLRSGIEFPASNVVDGTETDASKNSAVTRVGVQLLPSYKIGNITVFFFTGLGIRSIADYEKTGAPAIYATNKSNSIVDWFVNPYVFIPAGGVRFKVGFQLYSNGENNMVTKPGEEAVPTVNWAIPFGFYAYF